MSDRLADLVREPLLANDPKHEALPVPKELDGHEGEIALRVLGKDEVAFEILPAGEAFSRRENVHRLSFPGIDESRLIAFPALVLHRHIDEAGEVGSSVLGHGVLH